MLESMHNHFRALLASRREALAAEIHAKLEDARAQHVSADAATTVDGGDVATLANARNIDLAEAARDNREMAQLDAALARLDAGRFGTCIDCGREIPLARLLAYPPAARCTACQQAHESSATGIERD